MADKIVKLKDGNDYLYPYSATAIDFNNNIATFSNVGDISYTATDNCVACASYQGIIWYIDGTLMGGYNSSKLGFTAGDNFIYLSKGTTIRYVWGNNNIGVYIYGLK